MPLPRLFDTKPEISKQPSLSNLRCRLELVFSKMICIFHWSIIFDWNKNARKELNIYFLDKLVVIWLTTKKRLFIQHDVNRSTASISNLYYSVWLPYMTKKFPFWALRVWWNLQKSRQGQKSVVLYIVTNLVCSCNLFSILLLMYKTIKRRFLSLVAVQINLFFVVPYTLRR